MLREQLIADFFQAIETDPRIGVSHISLYCAICCIKCTDDLHVYFKSKTLMLAAKIFGLGTYHKCIRDLADFGYIKYMPSYNHRNDSSIQLLPLKGASHTV